DGGVRHPRHDRGSLRRRRDRAHARGSNPAARHTRRPHAAARRSLRDRIHPRPASLGCGRATERLMRGLPALVLALPLVAGTAASVTIGSKAFPESWVLGEALATAMREDGVTGVTHRNNLGGTEIVFEALRSGG